MVWPALSDLELCQLLDVRVDGVGEAAQQSCAVARSDASPSLEGAGGPLDGCVGTRLVELLDACDDALRRRVDDVVRSVVMACPSESLEVSSALPVGHR